VKTIRGVGKEGGNHKAFLYSLSCVFDRGEGRKEGMGKKNLEEVLAKKRGFQGCESSMPSGCPS